MASRALQGTADLRLRAGKSIAGPTPVSESCSEGAVPWLRHSHGVAFAASQRSSHGGVDLNGSACTSSGSSTRTCARLTHPACVRACVRMCESARVGACVGGVAWGAAACADAGVVDGVAAGAQGVQGAAHPRAAPRLQAAATVIATVLEPS